MEAAKTSLLATQNSIHVALGLEHFVVTREERRSLQQLQMKHTASALVVQAIKDLATEIRAVQKDDRLVAQRNNVSLNQALLKSQTLLTQSAAAEQSADKAMVAHSRMEDAFASLSTEIRSGFDNFPTSLAIMIQEAMEKSLAKHNASRQVGVLSQDQMSVDASASTHKASTCNDDMCSSHQETSSERPLLSSRCASSMERIDSCLMPKESAARSGGFMLSSKRGPKRQKTSKSLFNFWFAQIEIMSSTTEQEDDVESDYILPMRLQARRISFRIVPNLWFLKTCLLFESGDSTPTVSPPGWDNRLRGIRTHPHDSAVAKAIDDADYV